MTVGPSSTEGSDVTLQMNDTDGVAERFVDGFNAYLAEQKRAAVLEVLQEELPGLANDDAFINRVVSRMNDSDMMDEKRFVFLMMNPKYQGANANPV